MRATDELGASRYRMYAALGRCSSTHRASQECTVCFSEHVQNETQGGCRQKCPLDVQAWFGGTLAQSTTRPKRTCQHAWKYATFPLLSSNTKSGSPCLHASLLRVKRGRYPPPAPRGSAAVCFLYSLKSGCAACQPATGAIYSCNELYAP